MLGVMKGLFIEPVLEGEVHSNLFYAWGLDWIKVLTKGRCGKSSSWETWEKRLKTYLRMGGWM